MEVLEAGVAPGGQLTVFYDPSTAMNRIGPVVELSPSPLAQRFVMPKFPGKDVVFEGT